MKWMTIVFGMCTVVQGEKKGDKNTSVSGWLTRTTSFVANFQL